MPGRAILAGRDGGAFRQMIFGPVRSRFTRPQIDSPQAIRDEQAMVIGKFIK